MKKCKRVISLLLSLVMLLSVAPLSAFAQSYIPAPEAELTPSGGAYAGVAVGIMLTGEMANETIIDYYWEISKDNAQTWQAAQCQDERYIPTAGDMGCRIRCVFKLANKNEYYVTDSSIVKQTLSGVLAIEGDCAVVNKEILTSRTDDLTAFNDTIIEYNWEISSDKINWSSLNNHEASYTPTNSDIGKFVKVKATFTEYGVFESQVVEVYNAAISNINAQFTVPSDSELLNGELSVEDDVRFSNYYIDQVFNITDNTYMNVSNEKFEAGKKYRFECSFAAADGFIFGNNVDVTINGIKADYFDVEYNSDTLTCYSVALEIPTPVKSGWNLIEGYWYYYYEDGQMATDTWLMDSVGWCYLGEDGKCVTNAWKADSIGWCYLDANGRMAKECWVADYSGWCYLDENGYMATDRWAMDSIGWCYLDSTGHCATDTWKADSVGWVYLDSNGRMVTWSWVIDSVDWCYVGGDGYMVTNTWIADSQGWCYLDAWGHLMRNDWAKDSTGWHWIDETGHMAW